MDRFLSDSSDEANCSVLKRFRGCGLEGVQVLKGPTGIIMIMGKINVKLTKMREICSNRLITTADNP